MVSLGLTSGICHLAAGPKWLQIHERSHFIRNPGDQQWDIALFKNFVLKGSHRLQFRAETRAAPVDVQRPEETVAEGCVALPTVAPFVHLGMRAVDADLERPEPRPAVERREHRAHQGLDGEAGAVGDEIDAAAMGHGRVRNQWGSHRCGAIGTVACRLV